MTNDYDDVINLPHYEPKHHPRMSMWNRAAQFAPFAALTGYDAAIQESREHFRAQEAEYKCMWKSIESPQHN